MLLCQKSYLGILWCNLLKIQMLHTAKNHILVTGKFDSFILQCGQFLDLLLLILTKQIHVAEQKHASIQHPFDKCWHEMHSILLSHKDEVFQLPALLCLNRGKVSVH